MRVLPFPSQPRIVCRLLNSSFFEGCRQAQEEARQAQKGARQAQGEANRAKLRVEQERQEKERLLAPLRELGIEPRL